MSCQCNSVGRVPLFFFLIHLVLYQSLLIFTRADVYRILNMFKYNLKQLKYTIDKMSVYGFILG